MNKESGKIRNFQDLDAWREGHLLVLETYKVTKKFPREEIFGLISQMRRCAVSITSNIAEGFSRQSYKEKLQFYSISQGSVTELQNQLLISKDVGYMDESEFQKISEQSIKVHKIINGLIRHSKAVIPNS
ncbi:four helix bundle protein [Patescibacteria group bacterium]|nr:four helix bundle protein [Patescibacteria group bacterium]